MNKRYLISIAVGTTGMVMAMGGVALGKKGIEDIEDCLYDFTANKVDMYDASCKGLCKILGGVAMSTVGGTMVGAAIGNAYIAGNEDIETAPVMISADTIEAAQEHLDLLKKIAEPS